MFPSTFPIQSYGCLLSFLVSTWKGRELNLLKTTIPIGRSVSLSEMKKGETIIGGKES